MKQMKELSSHGEPMRRDIYTVSILIVVGFEVETPDGPMVAKARLLMCSVDLLAKAIVFNTKQFNGKHGCTYCEEEGITRSTSHLHRNWPYSMSKPCQNTC